MGQKNKIDNTYRQIGKKAYSLVKAGSITDNALLLLAKEIDKLTDSIKDMESNVKTIYTDKRISVKKSAVGKKK